MSSSSYKILVSVGKMGSFANVRIRLPYVYSNLMLRRAQHTLSVNHNKKQAYSSDCTSLLQTRFGSFAPTVPKPFPVIQPCNSAFLQLQGFSTKAAGNANDSKEMEKQEEKQLSLIQRFKQMYKEYWYVLIPVHLVTSAAWFGSFYYAAKSGIDIIPLMESLGLSEKLINPLRNSSAGYVAIAYAMYKIATPARYAVTVGGTTVSIKYLRDWGYIKPMPSSDTLRAMYAEKRSLMNAKREVWRMEIRKKRAELKKRSQELTFKRKARR